MIDTHTHYLKEMYKDKLDELISNLELEFVINVSINLNSAKQALDLFKKNKKLIPTVGIHPNDVNELNSSWEDEMNSLITDDVVAIGEIGLDYYRIDENKNLQKEIFIKQIAIANKKKLPIIIHSRTPEAIEDVIEITNKDNETKYLFHSWSGTVEQTKKLLEKENIYFSFNGISTYKNAQEIRDLFEHIPLNRIMFETDSPWLSPEPLRGKENNSNNVKYVYENYSEYMNIDLDIVVKQVRQNIKEFFGI